MARTRSKSSSAFAAAGRSTLLAAARSRRWESTSLAEA